MLHPITLVRCKRGCLPPNEVLLIVHTERVIVHDHVLGGVVIAVHVTGKWILCEIHQEGVWGDVVARLWGRSAVSFIAGRLGPSARVSCDEGSVVIRGGGS